MELLSIEETAELLKAKESTVRTWINRKQIPTTVIFKVGHTTRIIKDKLIEWVYRNGCLQEQ